MTDLITFLTSMEAIVVYAIACFSAVLWIFVRFAQKTYDLKRLKNNTMELNRLVEEIQDYTGESSNVVSIEKDENQVAVEPNLPRSEPVEAVAIIPEVLIDETVLKENTATDNMILEMNVDTPLEAVKEEVLEDEIQYESIVPDQTVAQAELEKLTEELQKAEEKAQNIELTKFEAEQEENAIISLDELLALGDTLYEKNEVTQYEDEGNEPISIQDLEERMRQQRENVVEMKPQKVVSQVEKVDVILAEEEQKEFPKSSEAYQNAHTFKSSPVISPIYGIEEKPTIHSKQTELELENTATLKKFDDEIRKTNEFVMTLKELQKNLE